MSVSIEVSVGQPNDVPPRSRRRDPGERLRHNDIENAYLLRLQLPLFQDALRRSLWLTSAATDIGTGTYTIATQLGAELLGLELRDVHVKIGDSDLPPARSPGPGAKIEGSLRLRT